MYAKVVTIITTEINLETFDTDHKVAIECEDSLPQQVVVAASIGACKSTLFSLEKQYGATGTELDPED